MKKMKTLIDDIIKGDRRAEIKAALAKVI